MRIVGSCHDTKRQKDISSDSMGDHTKPFTEKSREKLLGLIADLQNYIRYYGKR